MSDEEKNQIEVIAEDLYNSIVAFETEFNLKGKELKKARKELIKNRAAILKEKRKNISQKEICQIMINRINQMAKKRGKEIEL